MALPLPQPTSATRAPFSSFVFTSGTVLALRIPHYK
jgi:hypothetical protein